jgi:aminopeptidase N
LFALVAGKLDSIHDTYTTTSGKTIQLGIYSNNFIADTKKNAINQQLSHAMYSIKKSMQWDEDTFGLECDLDVYNIVATNDFNMGAM